METIFIVFFSLTIIWFMSLLIIQTVLLLKRRNKKDLIKALVPTYGYGFKRAISNTFGLIILFLIWIPKLINMFKLVNILFTVLHIILIVWVFIFYFNTIELRERGIFSKFRFIPWDNIIKYRIVTKHDSTNKIKKILVFQLSKCILNKSLIIREYLYKYEGSIEKLLEEKNVKCEELGGL